jgi:hypothetical protein
MTEERRKEIEEIANKGYASYRAPGAIIECLKEIDRLKSFSYELELKNIEIERIRGWLHVITKTLKGSDVKQKHCMDYLIIIDDGARKLQKALDQAIEVARIRVEENQVGDMWIECDSPSEANTVFGYPELTNVLQQKSFEAELNTNLDMWGKFNINSYPYI